MTPAVRYLRRNNGLLQAGAKRWSRAGDQIASWRSSICSRATPSFPRNHLPLDGVDLQTANGSVLVIDQVVYTVGIIAGGVAPLTPALPASQVGQNVDYELVQPSANIGATVGNLATLVELTAAPTARLAGINIPGGVPAFPTPVGAQSVFTAQSIALIENNWLLLASAWTTFPSAPTNADLIEEFILGNWSVERLERGYQNRNSPGKTLTAAAGSHSRTPFKMGPIISPRATKSVLWFRTTWPRLMSAHRRTIGFAPT